MPRAHLAQHRWGLSQAPSEPCTPHVEIILRYQSSLQTAKTKLRSILLAPERHPRTKVRSRRYPAERAAPSLAAFSFHPPRAPGSTPPCRGLMHTPEDTLASVCPLPLTPCSLATLLPWTRVDTPTAQSVRGSGKRPAQAVCGQVTTCAGDSRILWNVVRQCSGAGGSQQTAGDTALGPTPHSGERHGARPAWPWSGGSATTEPINAVPGGDTLLFQAVVYSCPVVSSLSKMYLGQNLRINSHHHFYCWSHFNPSNKF